MFKEHWYYEKENAAYFIEIVGKYFGMSTGGVCGVVVYHSQHSVVVFHNTETKFYTTGFGVRTGLDHIIFANGDRSVPGVE